MDATEASEETTETPEFDQSSDPVLRLLDEYRQYGKIGQQLTHKLVWPVIYYAANHAENNYQDIIGLMDENTALKEELKTLRGEFDLFKVKIMDELVSLRVKPAVESNSPAASSTLDAHETSNVPPRPTYAAVSGKGMPKMATKEKEQRAGSRLNQDSGTNQAKAGNQDKQAESTGWSKPKNRRTVRGTLKECPAAEPAKQGLFSLLKTTHKPKMDFVVSGIKHVRDTEFKTEGKPDFEKYGEALRNQLVDLDMDIRFVKIFSPREGDFRGTLCARIGGHAEDRERILSPDIWPSNVFVRPWIFEN